VYHLISQNCEAMQIFARDVLRDKVVVVTGGGTGIGRSIVLHMADHGAHVVLAGRRPDPLQDVAARVKTQGGKALAVPTDIRQPAQVDALVHTAVHAFGRVDILVNNAAGSFLAAARNLSARGWQAVIDTTLNGTFHCSQAVGAHMMTRGGGKIINITATLHYKGSPGLIAPAAAKAGVEALTKTLALEWAKYNILVNAIAPGPISTAGSERNLWSNPTFRDMVVRGVPLERFGSPADIAHMAIYLASPAGDYITGATMVVDGGEWLKKSAT
jgi:NAD(P)-dependent dehydrogenase (short-subunit alcohol dehydrogenase family)